MGEPGEWEPFLLGGGMSGKSRETHSKPLEPYGNPDVKAALGSSGLATHPPTVRGS